MAVVSFLVKRFSKFILLQRLFYKTVRKVNVYKGMRSPLCDKAYRARQL